MTALDGLVAAEDDGLAVQVAQSRPIPLDARFACAPGELLALVGPSGSGKSTLLRCIAGLARPESGEVRCAGETWLATGSGTSVPPQRRAVGFVFQSYALFPHLSALANVSVALGHLPPSRREARARELLDTVHLGGLEQRRPAALSGGQQQRVALARALAREPRVLLLDEPFSAVDQVTRRKLQRELARLRASLRMPIVLVTHDLEEARALADRICILHRGRTLQHGPPGEVLARPVSVQVARLVGLNNLFEGEIESHDPGHGHTLLRWHDYRLEAPHSPEHSPGSRVCWVIPPENVILHRRDRPSRGERENPVSGVIAECVTLGEMTSVSLLVDARRELPLGMAVPTHVARRNRLTEGGGIRVSLLRDGIHLMPWEALEPERA